MGNKQNTLLADPNLQKFKQHFSNLELYMLSLLFKDLAARQHGVMDKDTFLKFFPLTGLWGERLFEKFDRKHTGYIDFPEFIEGLALCCHSTEDEKIHYLFSLYDMDQDGFIKKKEMITMLYNYPKNHIKFITDDMAPDGGQKLERLTENKRRSFHNSEKDQSILVVPSINILESPMPKVKTLTMQSVHSDAVDAALNDELEVAGENKMPGNTLPVERDIKKPFNYFVQRESMANLNFVNVDDNERAKPKNLSRIDLRGLLDPATDRKVSGDRIVPSRNSNSRDYGTIMGGQDQLRITAVRKSSASLANADQSFVLSTTVNTRVKEYASFMFKTIDGANTRGKISYDEFKQWINLHPIILKVFDETFHQDIWATPRIPKTMGTKTNFTSGATEDDLRRFDSMSKGSKPFKYQEKPSEMSGDLYKKGKRSKNWVRRFFELHEHFLFYYENKNDSQPKGIFFLDGCEIDELKDYNTTKKYGFTISNKSESYENHVLYCNTKQEFDEWMSHLRIFKSSTIMDLYTFHEKIGTGKFSVVYRATCKNDKNKEYAVKVIEKKLLKPEEREFLLSETSVMKVLDHPNIIKLIDTVESKTHIYIITEIVKDGDLFDYIVNQEFVEEYDASFVMKQLLISVYYLHSIGIIHRDIKPENILISMDNHNQVKEVKIIDFGFAKLMNDDARLCETCGTPNYVAPEILRNCGYDKSADIWSLGVIMYLMVRGLLPFDAHDVNEILRNTLKADVPMEDEHWANISPEAKDLIQKFLSKEYDKRIDIATALKHPWIKNREALKSRIGVNRRNGAEPNSGDLNGAGF